ncbi:flagellar basal body rod protein [Pseudodonghicola flavimaris]|uniref:Flagellar basal body rod protein n=1 Tax=Pseudodonghicola flavimaris TaxID=3050036 RepID=A0ABT7EWK2_9RHOB|nr:flagellar basal body rod protein [Pseudodonghicola flavimaris]MDK3016713.1 flagellar basal body rod protein [Pseudodonghicola flavimaris]
MNHESLNLFQLASRRLQWLSDRQRTVSENIANADVADYRAREVESFASYLDSTEGVAVLPEAQVREVEGENGETISGNTVVLEEQILEAANTSGQYRLASNLYRKAHEMVLTVAGGS